MPPETDLIKQQMGQTREALSDKLQTLENKVIGTITTTTDTVSKTVQDVGAMFCETTHNVRAAMNDTVSSVRDAFDVSRQIHEHPWLMVGGSVLAGYVGGVVLDNLEHGHLPSLPSLPSAERLLPRGSEVRQRLESEPPSRRRGPAFLQALFESFAPELEKLKAAAVGMAFGVIRDRVGESVPPQMREDFSAMMDRLTTKLGGNLHPQGMWGRSEEEEEEGNGAHMSRSMGMS